MRNSSAKSAQVMKFILVLLACLIHIICLPNSSIPIIKADGLEDGFISCSGSAKLPFFNLGHYIVLAKFIINNKNQGILWKASQIPPRTCVTIITWNYYSSDMFFAKSGLNGPVSLTNIISGQPEET